VSYDLEATHYGPEDRCDCFTFDPRSRRASRITPRRTTPAPAPSTATESIAAISRARSIVPPPASTTRARSTSPTSCRRRPI
jgi:hypothetical protein